MLKRYTLHVAVHGEDGLRQPASGSRQASQTSKITRKLKFIEHEIQN